MKTWTPAMAKSYLRRDSSSDQCEGQWRPPPPPPASRGWTLLTWQYLDLLSLERVSRILTGLVGLGIEDIPRCVSKVLYVKDDTLSI